MSAAAAHPPIRLVPGDRAPAFSLPDADEKLVALTDYRGRRVVLYFYPAASTPGCTTEARDFRDNLGALSAAGFDVLAVSPDTPAALRTFRDHERLPFPLLADPEREVLRAYGAYGRKLLYGKEVTGVIRSTFIVSTTGRIDEARYNVKATGHVAKLLRELPGTG
ncbi:MAG: peroxiredoxin [Mycobacteriales bacterium]